MQTYFVGLDAWIIQDGNYGNFRVGETATFALEFNPHTMQLATSHEPLAERTGECRYRVRAQVLYARPSAWVIDFGAMAYQNEKPPRVARKGSWVEGEIYLGIDPFFYRDELHSRPGMPAMQYRWRVRSITLETTPWQSVKHEGSGTLLTRDERERSFIEVAETNAWEDDQGRAHYVLECQQIG
jgi:hypothetical protein